MSFPVNADTIRIYRGDDIVLATMELTDDLTNNPIDLSAHTFTAQWRSEADATTAITLAVDDSQSNVGIVSVSIANADTAQVSSKGVWDLQSVDTANGNKVKTWLLGNTTYQPDVTR